MRHPIILPQTDSPVQVLRVVVPDTGEPLSIFTASGVELITQSKPCLRRGRSTIELCAIAFAGADGFNGLTYGPSTEDGEERARSHKCVPADPVPSWSRVAQMVEMLRNIGSFTETKTGILEFKVVEEGPIRATFAARAELAGLHILVESTCYHGLPFVHFDFVIANSAANASPGHVDFDELAFHAPAGATVIALDSQGVDGFVMPTPGEPTTDETWTRGSGRVRLTPKSTTHHTLHSASEWACSFLLVPTKHATHPAIAAFAESPGFGSADTAPLLVDGVASVMSVHAISQPAVARNATAAASKAIDAYLAERAAGAKHSGSFPAGPSTDPRGASVGNALRHPLGQRDGGPTGSLAADPRSYEAHLGTDHPRLERYLREQEHGMFDRARYTLERDGAAYEPRGAEDFILQRSPPGEPFSRATNAPPGWFEALLGNPGDSPHTHGSADGQHFWLNGVVMRRVELTNARSARRRLDVLADAAHAHGPDPRALLIGAGRGTAMGRDEGWRLTMILSRYAVAPSDKDELFINRMIETAVLGQTAFGNIRMDSWSKEFAGNDSPYGRDVVSKRRNIAISEVPKLAGTSVYQESICACAFELAHDLGFDVPHDFRERHFRFVWVRAVSEGAVMPWYRVAVWLAGMQGSPTGAPCIEPAATTTSDFNAQHALSYGVLRGYEGAGDALRAYCFGADPLAWLSNGKADKFANRGALLSVLSGLHS